MPTVFLILLFTEVTDVVSVTLLLLLLCHYCYITVATDNLCQGSLLSGAVELTIHLLRLINIIWVLLPSKTVAIPYTCGSLVAAFRPPLRGTYHRQLASSP